MKASRSFDLEVGFINITAEIENSLMACVYQEKFNLPCKVQDKKVQHITYTFKVLV